MTFTGHIKDGVAIPDSPVTLPDGTRVRIEIDGISSESWTGKSIDELAREQGVGPITDPAKLAIDWPADEAIDEFLDLVRQVRH